ncbi:hypothetical protein AARAC_008856 [Aspergillus arachidicola]|uniref:Uncharacterized protein n=1 Tax=Aspergillus arachidicola TaxID=656916 RepID=A0A2G7EKZ4_9EURO|nr:hypothetical protein AARAC_008856 [Aspergillus arachidicola]
MSKALNAALTNTREATKEIKSEDLANHIDRRFLPPKMIHFGGDKKPNSQILADWDKDDNDEDNGYKWDDDDDGSERGLMYYVGGNTGDVWIKLAGVLILTMKSWSGGQSRSWLRFY